jgi:hypothetical protein
MKSMKLFLAYAEAVPGPDGFLFCFIKKIGSWLMGT